MSFNLNNLNREQEEAVLHQQGPLLIVAGAGTGKTTVITQRIAYLIENKLAKPEEILALTFTEKAASEMEERVDRLLDIGYSDLWVSTFHSFCERVLRDNALDIGLPSDFKLLDPTSAWLLARQNLDKFHLNYYKPLGSPAKFLRTLINHFSRCKDQGISPQDYLDYGSALKSNLTDLPEDVEAERIKEVADGFHVYQQLLLEKGFFDFGDLINYCLKLFQERPNILEKYRKQFKYILVDEFQDTNLAQYELIKMLAFPSNNLTVCADDDQCLPAHTMVETLSGEKEIRKIKEGDRVLTAVGKGHVGVSTVSKIFRNRKKVKLLTIKTKSGFRVSVTDNHKMFCFVARTFGKGFHYVYLMNRGGTEWRIGVTNDLIGRLRLERSADRIVGIKACTTDAEARYYETLWSLKYGIPTNCFMPRERTVIKDDLLKRLGKELNVERSAQRLAQDLNVDLASHQFCLDAVNRGKMIRVKIILRICCRRHRSKEHVKLQKLLLLNPLVGHELHVETSSLDIIAKLKKLGFKLRKARKNGMCLRIESDNLSDLGRKAEIIRRATGGIVEVRSNLAIKYPQSGGFVPRSFHSLVMPAKNLLLGHCLPVKKGREIIYDEIMSIKEEEKVTTVYDLEVEKTHNFIANGVVVHNSIYRWRGASYANIIQFRKDFSSAKEVFLIRNYRSTQNILDLSYNFIQENNPNRLEFVSDVSKKLISGIQMKGVVEHLHFSTLDEEAAGVANKIIEILEQDKETSLNDFVILVRANDHANPFCSALNRAGITYQFLASRGLYAKPAVLDVVSYFKLLDNYHESSALYRVLNFPFWGISQEDIMQLLHYAKKKSQSLFEALSEIPLVSGLSAKSIGAFNLISGLLKKHAAESRIKSPSEIFISFLADTGYLKFLTQKDDKPSLDCLNQFLRKIKAFEQGALDPNLRNFIEQLNLEIESGEEGKIEFDMEQGPDLARVMTIHAAKGLEFRYVFLVNLVDRRFPSAERKEPIELPDDLARDKKPEGDVHLQEERRLCYVALTRAKQGLFLTSADDYGQKTKKKPSRFLIEMGLAKEPSSVRGKASGQLEPAVAMGVGEGQTLPKIREGLPLPQEHYSFSQLAAFQKCPLQYKFAYVLKVPVPGKAVFSFGQTMHSTLYEFARQASDRGRQADLFGKKAKKEAPSLEELISIYERKWIDEWFESKSQKQEYYKLGKSILKDFHQQYLKEAPVIMEIANQLALEQTFKLKIRGYVLSGRIDRLDVLSSGVRIIDYKTGSCKDKLEAEDKQQLLIYQIAAEEIFGLNVQELQYYYLEEGKRVSFLGSEKEKQETKEKIISAILEIEASDFAAKPGWQCQYCDFRDICDFRER